MLTSTEIKHLRKIFKETDKKIVAQIKVLSDVNRYRIFRILSEQPKISVSDIAKILDISLPLASQHLKLLIHADLLQKERVGKRIFPKLKKNNPFVKEIAKTIKKTIKLID